MILLIVYAAVFQRKHAVHFFNLMSSLPTMPQEAQRIMVSSSSLFSSTAAALIIITQCYLWLHIACYISPTITPISSTIAHPRSCWFIHCVQLFSLIFHCCFSFICYPLFSGREDLDCLFLKTGCGCIATRATT